MAQKQIEILLDGNSIKIKTINAADPNTYDYINIGGIKSITGLSEASVGGFNGSVFRNAYHHDDKHEVTISFTDQDSSAPVVFDIQDVSNQAGWTADFTGLQQALSDINSWLLISGGGSISGYSLESTQIQVLAESKKQTGAGIPEYDYQALTYVAAGNGVGEVETITYKFGGAGGTTVATETLAYDASNRVISITKS